MQHFLNHETLEKAAAEVFSGPRARNYVLGLVGLAIAAAAGPATAAIWLGLALLIDEARRTLCAMIDNLPRQDRSSATLALALVDSAMLAAAPAIVWYSRAELGPALATSLLCLLLINSALGSRLGRRATAAACLPFAVLALLFVLEAAVADALLPALLVFASIAAAFAAVVHQVHGAKHARTQDAEWVRQLNMGFSGDRAAAWEIDFTERALVGAEKLSDMLGNEMNFEAFLGTDLWATPMDRALARAMFAPGATRQVALEHDVIGRDGAVVRVRHEGFLRTARDGTPLRLTCITRFAEAKPELLAGTLETAEAALGAQARTLGLIANELGAPNERIAPLPQSGSVIERLRLALAMIDRRGADIATGIDQLVRARDAADGANLAKSQFLANMSHELRTPLNAIIGYAEMLREDCEDTGDAAAAQDLSRILTSAHHLLGLIGEVLDLSKIEAGRMEIAPAPFDLTSMLHELVDSVRPLATQNGSTLQLHVECGVFTAFTDATRVRQCVLNLLSNACKFTQNGGIEARLTRRTLDGVDQFDIVVRDTGIGMTPEFVAQLFQPFVQADPHLAQRHGGTGLGLTITRRLALLMGGDVTVESIAGKGSVFTLTLPVDYADAQARNCATVGIDELRGAGPLVLLIEDEADAREIAARALTRAGFSVQGVGGGEAGLALARAKAPALVLLDIFLPDRSGWRVLQNLKQDPSTRDIPVIVLSVNEDRAQALALGAAEHLVKPTDRDRLAATAMRLARLPAAAPTQAPTVRRPLSA